MDDWEARMRAYDAAEQLAASGKVISNKNNPLLPTMDKSVPFFEQNMDTLRRDVRRRENPTHGSVYAGIMDNMRYGGNE